MRERATPSVVAPGIAVFAAIGLGVTIACLGCSGASPGGSLGTTDAAAIELPAARACVPGQQIACACPGGAPGAQTCNAAATGYDVCMGCSSSDASAAQLDAGPDGGHDAATSLEAGPPIDSGGRVPGGPGFDGTTGLSCMTDADCVSTNGPRVNRCSSDFVFSVGSLEAALFSPPVCIVAPVVSGGIATGGNCDPAPASDPNGTLPHFCDGPDDATSPGLCVAQTNPPQSGQGQCLPKCSFSVDGSPPTACPTNAACGTTVFTMSQTTGVVVGYGICEGYCRSDADCAPLGAGYSCQADMGLCTRAPIHRTSTPGTACSSTSTAACNCVVGPSGTGYCTESCVVGASDCPTGWVCDTAEPAALDFGTGTPVPVTPTPQLLGECLELCTVLDAGAPQCPASATCSDTSATGLDCQP